MLLVFIGARQACKVYHLPSAWATSSPASELGCAAFDGLLPHAGVEWRYLGAQSTAWSNL